MALMHSTLEHSGGEPESAGFSRRLDGTLVGVLVLGVVLRLVLFATGRTPIDGDEAIMGMMGYDLRSLDSMPIYFYGQSYLGALEIPLLAFIQLLGMTKSWAFSVWAVRLTAFAYLALFGAVHFQVARRLFGREVALPSVLFLVVGPYLWADYSSRLRHVVVMLLLGEILLLVLLRVIEDWNGARRENGKRLLVLGFLAGVAWWHYQLIAIFFIALFVLLFVYSDYLPDLVRTPLKRRKSEDPGSGSYRAGYVLRIVLLSIPIAVFVAMTLGKGWSYWPFYEWILLGLGAALAAALLFPYRVWRRERAEFVARADPSLSPWEALHHLAPAVVVTGFVIGSLPTVVYMATLRQEFWVHPTSLDLFSLIDRLRSSLWTEVGPMLDILRLDSFEAGSGQYGSPTSPRTYFYLVMYLLGGYALVRRFQRPRYPLERLGILFFLLFGFLVLFFRAAMPRNLSSLSPRFVMPLVLPASLLFGFAFHELAASVGEAGKRPKARMLARGVLSVVSLLVFLGSWREAPRVELDLKSGHRAYVLEIVKALRKHDVRRAYIEYTPGLDQGVSVPLGWELMHASRNEIRFHWATFDDRLFGRLDEDAYGWEEYYLYQPGRGVELDTFDPTADLEAGSGFDAADYRVVPLPEAYLPHRGWLPWSPRGDGNYTAGPLPEFEP